MGLSIQYETLEDAERCLTGTVVMYDGEPVYISGVGPAAPGDPKPDIFRVYAVPLPSANIERGGNEEIRKFISSRKFDLRTVKLGFVNLPDDVLVYCSRNPARQFKQGLCAATLACNLIIDPHGVRQVKLNTLLARQEFVDTIKGKYPSFEEACSTVERGFRTGAAFSREFAVVQDDELEGLTYLYYKDYKVGFVTGGVVNLTNKTSCLKEHLAELGVKV